MKKSFIFIICLLFLQICLFAQDTFKVFNAKLIDAETMGPVVNANIYSASRHGTTSNHEGVFSLYVNEADTIVISCIGYKRTKMMTANYPDFEGNILTFKIEPIVYTLSAVEIPFLNSVVIIPSSKNEVVDVGVSKEITAKEQPIGFRTENVDVRMKKDAQPSWERPMFGIGFTISGFLSSLINKESKEQRMLNTVKDGDAKTSLFDTFMASKELKHLLMDEPYKMSEEEYKSFVEEFTKNRNL